MADEIEIIEPTRPKFGGYNGHESYVSDEELTAALIACDGSIKKTAELLKLSSYTSLSDRLRRNPELRPIRREIEELKNDEAEDELMKLIRNGDYNAIRFRLTHKAKDRGWGDEIEINQNVTDINYDSLSLEKKMQLRSLIQEAKEAKKNADNESGGDRT